MWEGSLKGKWSEEGFGEDVGRLVSLVLVLRVESGIVGIVGRITLRHHLSLISG